MLRRLFQRLQQAVEGGLRKHVHFIDDVDLGARRDRAIARVLDDLAHVVDAGVRGGVHLDDVDMARLHDRLAMRAEFRHFDAGSIDLAGQAVVEGARENARGRRLADPAHAGQDIGLMDAIGFERIGERAHHRLLADQVGEAGGAVFTREHAIGSRLGGARAEVEPERRLGGDGVRDQVIHARTGLASGAQARGLGKRAAVGGWTKTRPGSLGLLPSGPDPVGERYVLRQPPGPYLDHADG